MYALEGGEETGTDFKSLLLICNDVGGHVHHQ